MRFVQPCLPRRAIASNDFSCNLRFSRFTSSSSASIFNELPHSTRVLSSPRPFCVFIPAVSSLSRFQCYGCFSSPSHKTMSSSQLFSSPVLCVFHGREFQAFWLFNKWAQLFGLLIAQKEKKKNQSYVLPSLVFHSCL